ncbi:bactofilin family protein [Anaerosporobacter faecicola]|uniref:polymer-forming cytoskeletal protein n=1 Tax=Anaerosporobacter faecicola TaxID=2718714 RepID=UPI00143BA1BD|nr:polymer-forming cytoskeletal protein [Anaerosporobacter faecicola]
MKEKEKGSALVLILLALLLITTLSMVVLSMSMVNLDMKQVDQKAKKNFYSAETALDEIKTGLEELVTTEIKEAYTQVLENYSKIHPSQREAKFKEYLRENLYIQLADIANPTLTSEKLRNILDGYVRKTPKYSDATKVGVCINETGAVQPSLLLTQTEALISNVYVRYQEKDYETIIQTDIKIDYPTTVLFDQSDPSKETFAVASYALVADQQLQIADSYGTTMSNIVGNIYAGEHGIIMANPGTLVSMAAQEIVTRGDLCVKDKARLYISGNATNRIWANNLRCELSNGVEATQDTIMDIHGNCIIRNDLVLDGNRSQVTINGTYMGYQRNQLTEGKSGSAIIVNGKNSVLNLEQVSSLVVAGNAAIQIPTYDSFGLFEKDSYIMTGDSISMKGNQIAYLVPSTCISVGHNPVLWEEYSQGVSVDLEKETTLALDEYVDMTEDGQQGYRTIFYRMPGGVNVVYYYLEFTDGKKAQKYLAEYSKQNPDQIDQLKLAFPVRRMDFLYGVTQSAGIATRLQEEDASLELLEATRTSAYFGEIEEKKKKEYYWMTRRLSIDEEECSYLDVDSLAKSFVNMDKIKEVTSGVIGRFAYQSNANDTYDIHILYNGQGKYASLTEGEEAGMEYVVQTPMNGLLVATGDVRVNANFTGLIIAGGTITIASNASVYADATIVNAIWNRGEDEINQYFYDVKENVISGGSILGGQSQILDLSNLISYQNWHKN